MTNVNDSVKSLKEHLRKLCEENSLCFANLPEVINKAGEHFSLLLKWNEKISLTTITDPKLAAIQLYFESLFATKFIDEKINSLTDIGTGAGFPGIPLALALQNIETVLIESDQRKFAFLGEVRRSLNLKNLILINQRFQNIFSESNVFTIRALEKLQTEIPHILKFTSKSKLLILFISYSSVKTILETYKNLLSNYRVEIIVLPESQNRVLLLLYNLNFS